MYQPITLRKRVVRGGRAVVRVQRVSTGTCLTAGVCPGCWNLPERRKELIEELKEQGVRVVSGKDRVDGSYFPGASHARECPYR